MPTRVVRLVLAHDQPLPERIFSAQSKGRFVQCSAEMAFIELHNHLKRWSTFTLVKDQIYVCLLHQDDRDRLGRKISLGNNSIQISGKRLSGEKGPAPDQFCLIRTSMEIPCVLIRLCFPPGVSGQMREEVENR